MEFTLVESKKKANLKKNMIINHHINQPTYEKKILTQEEMTEVLISKIKNDNNIEIKTKEITKEKGIFYAINIRADLSKIGNGVFHSAKINTVSHINRVVNIKMVFSDNETLHDDMKVNVDSLFQCFREIAPDTIIDIHIETFKDQIDNEHLCIILSTIKGSSLTYVYKRMIDFVHVINDKYGALTSSKYNKVNINDIADEMIDEINDNTEITEKTDTLPIILDTNEEEVKAEVKAEVKLETDNNKSIINNSILNVIEQLVKEEKRLLLDLENVRKLIKSQSNTLEISKSQDNTQNISQTTIDKTSFAYKVMNGV